MPATLRALTAVAMLLFTAGACDSPTDPEHVAGTYVLETVDGAPLPAVTLENPGVRVERLSDVLQLRANGTGRQIVRERVAMLDAGTAATEDEATWELDFDARAGRVEISYRCGPNALCVEGPHLTGELEGGRLVLLHVGELGAKKFVYRQLVP